MNYQQKFLAEIRSGSYQGGSIPPDILFAAKVLVLIDENFVEHRDLTFYCEQTRNSLYKLNLLMGWVFNKTLYAVIQDRIHFEAEHLLLHSSLSAKEITFKLGLDNPAYFSRYFKHMTGLTPIEYRTKHNNWRRNQKN